MHYAVLSDIGKKRTLNEDRAAVFTLPDGLMLAVIADGMGGHRGGKFASATALRLMEEAFMKITSSSFDLQEEWMEWLKETVLYVNRALFNYAAEHEELEGMGTTLEAILIHNDSCYGAHIGDSRVYQVVDGDIQQLTVDHSYVKVLLDNGEITEQEAEVHPQRNWIIKALGSERSVDPDCYSIELKAATYLLMCSDGLSNKVDNLTLRNTIMSGQTLTETVTALVEKANEMGGEDNISVILLETPSSEVHSS